MEHGNHVYLMIFLISFVPYRSGRGVTPEFVIKQLVQPRFVLLVEETGNMNLRVGGKFVKHFLSKALSGELYRLCMLQVYSQSRSPGNPTLQKGVYCIKESWDVAKRFFHQPFLISPLHVTKSAFYSVKCHSNFFAREICEDISLV
jgi:hypothetical protein